VHCPGRGAVEFLAWKMRTARAVVTDGNTGVGGQTSVLLAGLEPARCSMNATFS
jgi:hypothetical protein